MNASAVAVLNGSPCQSGEPSDTPDLQHSRYTSGESDDDSTHATPSDMTLAAQGSPQETWTTTKSMRSDFPIRAEEEVRKIHYIDTPAQVPSDATTMPSAPAIEQDASSTAPTAPPQTTDGSSSFAALSTTSTIPPPVTAVTAASQPATSEAPTSTPAPAPPAGSKAESIQSLAAPSGPPSSAEPAKSLSSTAEATPSHLATTASSSAASTPASTPGATPQTYARKRGRPRKHPLPDPNNPPPPKTKRKLSADAAAAKKKASANAAARSAASNAASLLSVPDLGRLIPQGSSSENAQNFIQNNLRLFADLFVALQKQASTDHAVRDEANTQLTGIARVGVGPEIATNQDSAVAAADEPMPASNEASASAPIVTTDPVAHQPSQSATAAPATPLSKVSGPSDAIRDEIKKKMAEVSKGREAIQAEILQMRVDASFFETAQKTVDERIVILRERIAKHTAVLEREREATRKVREATRKAKKDRKAREKSLRDSEREERRLAQTFIQLEKEIAAEEEERRRLEEEESDDEEGGQAEKGADHGTATASAFNAEAVTTSPSDGSSASGIATPPVSNDTPAPADRAIGFSDEELAKILGISTSELAGFSQTLELTSLQPSSDPVNGQETANASANSDPSSSIASLLSAGLDSSEQPVVDAADVASDNFDIAAFLEMASSFGQMPDETATSQTQDNS